MQRVCGGVKTHVERGGLFQLLVEFLFKGGLRNESALFENIENVRHDRLSFYILLAMSNDVPQDTHALLNLLYGAVGKIQAQGVCVPAFCKEMGTGHVGNVTLHALVKHGSGIHSLGQFHPDEQSALGLGIGSTGREGFQLLQHGLQLNRVTFADLLDMLWQQTFLKIFCNDGLVEVGRMHIRRLLPNGALADNARITRQDIPPANRG